MYEPINPKPSENTCNNVLSNGESSRNTETTTNMIDTSTADPTRKNPERLSILSNVVRGVVAHGAMRSLSKEAKGEG
ncbi:hypothetical protein D9M69_589370 [compost metagenome]